MGRIESGGMVLVDLEEAKTLLKKSRATIFRLISQGKLVNISLTGSRTVYLTLDSIDRVNTKVPALNPEVPPEALVREVHLRFPDIITRPGLRQMNLFLPDPIPWSEG